MAGFFWASFNCVRRRLILPMFFPFSKVSLASGCSAKNRFRVLMPTPKKDAASASVTIIWPMPDNSFRVRSSQMIFFGLPIFGF